MVLEMTRDDVLSLTDSDLISYYDRSVSALSKFDRELQLLYNGVWIP